MTIPDPLHALIARWREDRTCYENLAEQSGEQSDLSYAIACRDHADELEAVLAASSPELKQITALELFSELELALYGKDGNTWEVHQAERVMRVLRKALAAASPAPQLELDRGFEKLAEAITDAELPVCPIHVDAEFVCPECFKAELFGAASPAPPEPPKDYGVYAPDVERELSEDYTTSAARPPAQEPAP